MVYHSEAHPEQRVIMACGHLFNLDLPAPTKDCLTCRGSGQVYFEDDDKSVKCQQCGGIGGKRLLPPQRDHRRIPYEPQREGTGRVSADNSINIPVRMRPLLPFRPEDFVSLTPTDNGLEIAKADRSIDRLYPNWHLRPVPELLSLVSLEHGDRLRLRVFDDVLLIEKAPQMTVSRLESVPTPRPEPSPHASLLQAKNNSKK